MVKLIWDLQDLGLPRLFLTSSLCLNWIHELIMNRNVWETCGKTVTTEDLEWAVHDVCLVFPEHADSTNVNIVMTVGVDSFFPHFLLFLFTHNPWRTAHPDLLRVCAHISMNHLSLFMCCWNLILPPEETNPAPPCSQLCSSSIFSSNTC